MGRTVVIVDDHPTFRRFARRLLEEAGFQVVGEAHDGASALVEIGARGPEVVLLDVMLPDHSGVDVAKRISSLFPAVDVVLVSSRSADDLGLTSLACGTSFVRKDELLVGRLEALLGARP